MSPDDVEAIAKLAGREAAQETLITLGIDATNPLETQRDFAHLRWWREILESVMKAAVIAGVVSFGGTLGALIYAGFRLSLR